MNISGNSKYQTIRDVDFISSILFLGNPKINLNIDDMFVINLLLNIGSEIFLNRRTVYFPKTLLMYCNIYYIAIVRTQIEFRWWVQLTKTMTLEFQKFSHENICNFAIFRKKTKKTVKYRSIHIAHKNKEMCYANKTLIINTRGLGFLCQYTSLFITSFNSS